MGWEPITECKICGDQFDVYRAPDERICESCLELTDEPMVQYIPPTEFGWMPPAARTLEEAFKMVQFSGYRPGTGAYVPPPVEAPKPRTRGPRTQAQNDAAFYAIVGTAIFIGLLLLGVF